MTRKKQYDDDPPPVEEMEKQPTMPSPEIQPGCSEPGSAPPSVGGTTHDPKRKKEE